MAEPGDLSRLVRGALLSGALALCACMPAPSRPAAAGGATGAEEDPLVKPAFKRGCDTYAAAPVQIAYEDAPGGASVLYRTRGDVASLRERAREVARYHNDARGKTPWMHDLSALPHRASVVDIEGGAQLTLVPKRFSPRAQEKLRIQVQQDVWHMQREGCGASQEAL